MLAVLTLHNNLANAIILYAVALGAWGAWLVVRRQGVTPAFVAALVIAEILVAVQVILGVTLYLAGARAAALFHYMYGALALLALPAAWGYAQGNRSRQTVLLYTFIALVIAILAWRGTQTALPGG